MPDDELSAQMQEHIEVRLAEAGFGHYETSAFALPGRQCRHNLNYWRYGDYVGIGAGAHAKISLPQRIVRQMRWKNPREYMHKALQGGPVQAELEVASAERGFEFMMNALRLTQGFELRLFEERTGLTLTSMLAPLARAEALGLVQRDHERAGPTLRGQRFLNAIGRTALGGHLAQQGDILIDEATADALGDVVTIQEWRATTRGTSVLRSFARSRSRSRRRRCRCWTWAIFLPKNCTRGCTAPWSSGNNRDRARS